MSKESPKAEEAFADYVALGPKRSLRILLARYCQRSANEVPTKRFETLAKWSGLYRWQERLLESVTAKSAGLLDQAAEYDAESFVKSSELIHDRLDWSTPHDLDSVLKMRESVRPKSQKGATFDINLTVAAKTEAEKLAAELTAKGIPTAAEDLLVSEEVRG